MIAVLLFGGGWHLAWWAWVIFVLGLLVFACAAISLGSANFTIMPDPRDANTISTHGIYRYIRHPMYTAVLLCGIAVTVGEPSVWRWVALLACTGVLVIKIRYEEALLTAKHPSYRERMANMARLFPGLW